MLSVDVLWRDFLRGKAISCENNVGEFEHQRQEISKIITWKLTVRFVFGIKPGRKSIATFCLGDILSGM